ncbi:MAG: hypothetical protein GSR73_03190 [Desulfurococcales archaeon]|nr:hypothetical protein [Desulfurococcales archaeon]
MTAAALVPGSQLFIAEVKSPIGIIVEAISVFFGLVLYAYYRSKPGSRGKAKLVLVATLSALAIIPLTSYVLTRPGVDYGAVLNGTTLTVTYYGASRETFNICSVNVSLQPIDKALEILKVRTNGVADPSTGIFMGHYRTVDGRPAIVIVWKKTTTKALVVDNGKLVAIIGVKGVEDLYNAIVQAKENYCGQPP